MTMPRPKTYANPDDALTMGLLARIPLDVLQSVEARLRRTRKRGFMISNSTSMVVYARAYALASVQYVLERYEAMSAAVGGPEPSPVLALTDDKLIRKGKQE